MTNLIWHEIVNLTQTDYENETKQNTEPEIVLSQVSFVAMPHTLQHANKALITTDLCLTKIIFRTHQSF